MKAETRTLQDVLHGDRQFVVPVYQRPYVWELEKQWEPLWNDIESTAVRLAEARNDGYNKKLEASVADQSAPPHFLGAIVIEYRPVRTGDVDTRLVVDGQQRLTTIQLLFRGVLDALEGSESDSRLRARLRKAVRNDDEVVDPTELLKVTPRRTEQAEFSAAMAATPPPEEDSKFAVARAYFRKSATDFLHDTDVPTDPYASGSETEARASLLTATLLGLVKLVVIDLDDVDDAQVIFEALNARNTPLSATDLVKNLLFMRAENQHHDPDQLYEELWKRFDDASTWWLQPVGLGHAQRARQDWLLGDWLIAELGKTINVGRLYGEFRRWLEDSGVKPFDALQTLNQYADAYEALNGRLPGATTLERQAFQRIERLSITVAMPLLLWLIVQPSDLLPEKERQKAVLAVESFVVRRMAVKYQTRGYGQVFVELLKEAQGAASHPGEAVVNALRHKLHGYEWPTLEDLQGAFENGRYYGPGGINRDRLRLLLGSVDEQLQAEAYKSENIRIEYGPLQVEHIIPTSWRESWPIVIVDPNERLVAEQRRDQYVNRIGNLTLANDRLNPSMSNNPWAAKRKELGRHSKLQLNALLLEQDDWNEERIATRGRWLAEQVEKVWPGPHSPTWTSDLDS